ncbi:MAG: HD domain-containing protein [Anaerolineae bacterium]|nr:HD domain-containing protein [Anaerolineae bacterium]
MLGSDVCSLEAAVTQLRHEQNFTVAFVEALNELSEAYFGIDAAHSLQLSQEAYEIALALQDAPHQVASLWQMGWVYAVQGEMDKSLAKTAAAHTLVQEIKDLRLEAKVVYVLGLIHGVIGNFPESLQHRMRALEIAREVGNRTLEADSLNAIGVQYLELGDHTQALNNYSLALQIYRELQNNREPMVLINIADASTQLKDYPQALHYAKTALEVSRRMETIWYESSILRIMGTVYLQVGDGEAALSCYQQAASVHLKSEANGQVLSPPEHLSLMIDMGKAHMLRQAENQATQIWAGALDEARRVGAKPFQMQLHELLYQQDKNSGELDAALKHHEAWAELKQEIFNAETDRRIKTLQMMYDTKEAQREAEILRLKTTELERMVQSRTRALEASQIEMLERLAIAIEARDTGTGDHIKRVGALSADLAQALGMEAETVELIRLAAPLHDIGKISIPDTILLKREGLTDDEAALMREHTVVGAKMLSQGSSKLLRMAETIALSHHERWDGKGYPDGLAGDKIPLLARIVAVADAFDAMTSDRPYRPAMPADRARCLAAGMDDHIAKPLDARRLGAVLNKWLSPALATSAKATARGGA